MLKNKRTFIIGIFIFLTLFIIKKVWDAGEFKTVNPRCNCSCSRITVPGPEDIAIDRSRGIAFISSFDRARYVETGERIAGSLYAYYLNTKRPELKNLLNKELPFPFYPHGLALYQQNRGELLLYVINHRTRTNHTVEIFEFKNMKLSHRETIAGPLLLSPNDITVVAPRQFYVTNDHGATSRIGRLLEDYLMIAISTVVYFDGKEFTSVAGGIGYANGIAHKGDGSRIYVAGTTGKTVHVFNRDEQTGGLTLNFIIGLDTAPDNIEVDDMDNLWIGCHLKLLTFTRHAAKPATLLAPSHVIQMRIDGPGKYQIEDIYIDDGNELSGSSAGVPFKDSLLIGSVFNKHFLHCRMSKL